MRITAYVCQEGHVHIEFVDDAGYQHGLAMDIDQWLSMADDVAGDIERYAAKKDDQIGPAQGHA